MIFKITVVSDERDDFVRVIEINSDDTFMQLHDAIFQSVGYTTQDITSFFICNDEWEKEQEITMIEMESSSEYDNYTMEETPLDELLEDEKQKMILTFDMLSDRSFFMELTEMIPSQSHPKALCVHKEGEAPIQYIEEPPTPTPIKNLQQQTETDEDDDKENLYGEDIDDTDALENLNIEDKSI